MKKRILSYVLAVLSYIVSCIIILGVIMLIVKFGFNKVFWFTILIVMNIVGIKGCADEIYKRLNR